MGIEDNKAIVEKVYEATSSQEHDIIDELVDYNYKRHALNSTNILIGRDRFKSNINARFTTKTIVAEGDLVMCHRVIDGTHDKEYLGVSPTGKSFHVSHISIERVVDGKLVEGWGLVDNLSFFQQVGVLPIDLSSR